MPAHFQIREGDDCHNEGAMAADGLHEWVVLVGGNGEVMLQSETFPAGHGNASRNIDDVLAAVTEAKDQPVVHRRAK